MHYQSIFLSVRRIVLLALLLSFHIRSSHCANESTLQSLEEPTAVTIAPPVSSYWTTSLDVLKTRYEKQCSAWRESPLLQHGQHEVGAVVFRFGIGFGGLGNKLRVLIGNFWVSLLLKKRLLIQGVNGVDFGMFFKPNLYNWTIPPGISLTSENLPSFNCSDLVSHMGNIDALPLHISLHDCSSKRSQMIDIGAVLRESRTVSTGFATEVMKLWETRHCFLQSMFMVTDTVHSFLPKDFFMAHERIGFHVRWGDVYLKTVQTDSHFSDDKKRVKKDQVKSCLKKLCKPATYGIHPSVQKPLFIYMATDVPKKLYSVYTEMYKSGNTTQRSCLSNIQMLSNRHSYHTGRHTSLASVDNIFLLAIADFVALAYSEIIVAPAHSSFSEQAAMFGLVLKKDCKSDSFTVPQLSI